MADPLTVTAAPDGSALMALTVLVLTGAGGAGAATNNQGTSATLTPTGTGSRIYGMLYEVSGNPFPDEYYAPRPGTEIINDSWYPSGTHGEAVSFRSAALTTAGTPVTAGVTPTGQEFVPACMVCEILASGTLAEHASSPPPLPGPAPQNASMRGAAGLTTDEFTPPGGSLLLAMAIAQATGGLAVSDSSGLTWSQAAQVVLSTPSIGRIWTARVPGSAGPPVLARFVVDAPAATPWPVLPAGTPASPPGSPAGTRGRAGSAATASGPLWPTTLVPGQVLLLDPDGAEYAAISAVVHAKALRRGPEDIGHPGLAN